MSTNDLKREISILKHELERISAAREVENLVNRYTYKLQANRFDEVLKLFALKTPGVTVELLNSGVYEGAEAVRKLFIELHPKHLSPPLPGIMFVDCNSTPLIEVAGDGKTAKGLWYSNICLAGKDKNGKLEARWAYQKRAMDFVKEDGQWKIWHYHAYLIFSCPFEKSWIEMTEEDYAPGVGLMSPLPPELLPTKPTTYYNPYVASKYVIEYVPPAPEPYTTWQETFSY